MQRDLGHERKTTSGGGFDRASQRLAVTDQLIEIRCTARDLGDRPVVDRCAKRIYVHLQNEVEERRIRWWQAELDAKASGQCRVVADGKTIQIPQALATIQDPQLATSAADAG